MSNSQFFNEYGYHRDMEGRLREIQINEDSLSAHAANQIKHLKNSLKELVGIVEIHQNHTGNNFAWAELDEAKKALNHE